MHAGAAVRCCSPGERAWTMAERLKGWMDLNGGCKPTMACTDPVAAPAQVVVFVQLVQILVSYFECHALSLGPLGTLVICQGVMLLVVPAIVATISSSYFPRSLRTMEFDIIWYHLTSLSSKTWLIGSESTSSVVGGSRYATGGITIEVFWHLTDLHHGCPPAVEIGFFVSLIWVVKAVDLDVFFFMGRFQVPQV